MTAPEVQRQMLAVAMARGREEEVAFACSTYTFVWSQPIRPGGRVHMPKRVQGKLHERARR